MVTQETKQKIKTGGAVGAGIGAAGLLGYLQGSGIDHIFADKIIEALKEGDLSKLAAYAFIFLAIWLEVRGLKKAVASLNSNINSPDGIIAKSFAKGEVRFDAIEKEQIIIRQDLDLLLKTHGGTLHEKPSYI